MNSKAQSYALGHSSHEANRLQAQAVQVEDLTRDVLQRAGIGAGMRVLDIGSGAGDVTILAAGMVGPEGFVLGVEKADTSVELARKRAAELGLANVRFAAGDLATFEPEEGFDAIIGRFVLSYVPDRATVLRRLSRFLNPRGIVASLEIDISLISQSPANPLFKQVRQWVQASFAAGGTELEMGARLHSTYFEAGLPLPTLLAAQPAFGPDGQGYHDLAVILRSLLPVMERHGIANAAEIDVETIEDRLRAEAAANGSVLFLSRIVGAWTRLGR